MGKLVSVFGKPNEIFDELNASAFRYAAEKGVDYVWTPLSEFTNESVIVALRDADACLVDVEKYDAEIFSKISGKTKLLIRFGVGYDAVNLKDASEYGILVTRTQGANATGVAEQALTLMLAVKRKVVEQHNSMASGLWSREIGTELAGTTVGIVGFGAVGQTLAKYLKGFDCRILVYDPYPNPKVADALGARHVELGELFRESDEISLHLPLNDETKKLINADLFGVMKKSAVLINTSRGGVIDEEAMIATLKEKKILGVGLDVFTTEPLPVDSPLRSLDNALLSPHIASNTVESIWATYKCAIDIAGSFFNHDMDALDRYVLNGELTA